MRSVGEIQTEHVIEVVSIGRGKVVLRHDHGIGRTETTLHAGEQIVIMGHHTWDSRGRPELTSLMQPIS